MRLPLWLLIVALPLHAEFLVPDQPYRCHPADTECKSKFKLSYYARPAGENYSLNFVEYNDRGEPWSPHQLTEAIAQIDKARADNPTALVLLYIHGWQNNANDTGDVSHFENDMLKVVSRAYFPATSQDKAPPVVGIYLAWRGLTFTAEPFKHVISYWPRRQVATRIGAKGMFDGVEQIRRKVDEPGQRQKTLFVLIGHSFGARVLENAVEGLDGTHQRQGFMKRYRAARINSPMSLNPGLPPADIIFFVNAATSSAVTRRTLKELRALCPKNSPDPICSTDPMYYAVTSHADLATGIIMPVANLVFPALFTDGLHLISAANSPWLHTHHDPAPISDCPPPPPQSPPCAAGDAFCFRAREEGKRTCYEVDPVHKDQKEQFWIMNVGGNLISSHGDVWNQDVIRLIQAVFKHNSRFRAMTSN